MIQRIQSLYILFYIINNCFLLYMSSNDINFFNFFSEKKDIDFLLLILANIFSIVILFNYKNRKTQIKLLFLTILIQLIILMSIIVLACKASNSIKYLLNQEVILYLLGLVFLFLSLRGINKDQKLIDSIDRIR